MNNKFKLMALGGLDENGKNAYLIETETEILIIDAGSANFINKELGIDTVIPDYGYLEYTKKKIVGILISHGHNDKMRSLANLIKKINVKVYGSIYTIEFLKHYINKKDQHLLNIIDYNNSLKLGSINVDVFNLSHSIYGNYGFVLSIDNQAIVYATDYNFDQVETKNARTDIQKIVKLANKYEIKALLTESINAEYEGVAAGSQNYMRMFERFIESTKGRTFISLYSSNLAGMKNIMKIAQQYKKKIVIIGRDLLNYVNIARKLGYIEHQKELFIRIPDMNKYDDINLIIVVSGLYGEPMMELGKMAINMHNILTIKETDNVLLAAPSTDETEADAQKILDKIARTHCNINTFEINVPSNAYREDIKMMINLFEPKFVVPIKGEYRKLKAVQNLAIDIGYDVINIPLLKNGDILEITQNYALIVDDINIQSSYISKNNKEEINPLLLHDREALSDGFVMIIMTFMKKSNELVQLPKIISQGLAHFDDEEIIRGCQRIVIK